ncbi:MAG: segregation and condensation protein A [Lachnospirales bacterium]
MEINIKLESFEGPMDLLYSLIIKNKIDIYDIPIAMITDQYLSYVDAMERANMDNISEFVVMAATLIEIKSKMLLPKEVDENNEEIDPRAELVQRLIEYKKFKILALEFNDKQKKAGYSFYKKEDRDIIKKVRKDVPKEISDILKGADGNMLLNAFREVLRRQEIKTDKIRSGFNSVKREEFSIDDRIRHIKNLLILKGKVNFFEIFDDTSSKNEIVVTFLAMLELIKTKVIVAEQSQLFDDIVISVYKEAV